MQKDNLILRGKVVDFEKGLFGLFLIVIDRKEGDTNIFNINAALGRSQFISVFDVGNPPLEELMKGITDLLLRGEATISDSKKLENILIKNKNLIMKLLEQEDMQNTLHMALLSRLNLFFESKFLLTIESHLSSEPYTYHDIISEIALKFSYEETNTFRKQFALPNDVDIIKFNPYLSVNGKYTMSLQKGDLIYCVPLKNIMENKILVQHHELLDEKGEFKKLIGTIEFIKPAQDALVLIIQVSPGLYGIVEVGNNVLIEVPLIAEHEESEEELLSGMNDNISTTSISEYIEKLIHNPIYSISLAGILVIIIIASYIALS